MGHRVCSKCKTDKPLVEFRKDSSRALGCSYICKPCNSAKDLKRYQSDVIGQQARGRDFYNKNKIRQRELRKARYWVNPDLSKAMVKKWYNEHLTEVLAYNAQRRAAEINAKPIWLTAIEEAQMQEMYDVAKARAVQTGIEHHVDHIFPLKGENFSGLHIPLNLQVIPAFDNLSKKNKFPEEYQHLAWEI